jgi:hypothetical protein
MEERSVIFYFAWCVVIDFRFRDNRRRNSPAGRDPLMDLQCIHWIVLRLASGSRPALRLRSGARQLTRFVFYASHLRLRAITRLISDNRPEDVLFPQELWL